MRERTLGNSSTKVQKQIAEQHTEHHMKRALRFLDAWESFYALASKGLFSMPRASVPIPHLPPNPKPGWFLVVYF